MFPKARIATVAATFCRPVALVSLAAILGTGCGKRPISNADGGDAAGGLTGAAGAGPAGDGGGGGSVVGNGGRGGLAGGASGSAGVGGGAGTAVCGRGGTGGGATGGTSATGTGGTGGAIGGRGGGAGTGTGTGGRGGSAGTGGSAGSTGGSGAGTGGTAAGGRGGSGGGGGTGGGVGGTGGGVGGTGGGVGGKGGGGTGGAIGGTGGSAAGKGGAGGRGGAGGTGGKGPPAVVPCPSSPPSGACAVENLTCSYPTGSCFCEHATWNCTACPATQPRPFDSCAVPNKALMNCTYGSVTCSCNDYNVGTSWICGVCPAQAPTTGDRCSANAPFECRYGADNNCVCDGTTWYCSDMPQCEGPKPDAYPFNCISPAIYTCAFPAQDQVCSCGNVNWGTLCSCPTATPVENTQCQGPVGGGCDYGDRVCDCVNGRWWCGACPLDPPANGASCSFATNCGYSTAFCYCDGTTWSCS